MLFSAVARNHREIARGLVMESLSKPGNIFCVGARGRPSHAVLAVSGGDAGVAADANSCADVCVPRLRGSVRLPFREDPGTRQTTCDSRGRDAYAKQLGKAKGCRRNNLTSLI